MLAGQQRPTERYSPAEQPAGSPAPPPPEEDGDEFVYYREGLVDGDGHRRYFIERIVAWVPERDSFRVKWHGFRRSTLQKREDMPPACVAEMERVIAHFEARAAAQPLPEHQGAMR